MIKELDYDQAVAKMVKLAKKTEDVAIFVDNGWGDRPGTNYHIVTNGNGQDPHASISQETYAKFLAEKIIGGNVLQTYKARKYHPFLNCAKDKSKMGKSFYRNTKEGRANGFSIRDMLK